MVGEYDRIFLEVKFANIVKKVGFASFEAVDKWTSAFRTKKELVEKTFGIPKGTKIEYVKVRYNYKDRKTHREVSKLLDIKYQQDNFDIKKLKANLKDYLTNHEGELDNPLFGIVYYPIPEKFKKELNLDYIFGVISYKTKRDIYFALRRLRLKEFKPSNRFQAMDMNNDEYLEYLQSLSLKDEAEASDELAKYYSLEQIPRLNIAGDKKPLLDGVRVERVSIPLDSDDTQGDEVPLTPEEFESLFKKQNSGTQKAITRVRKELKNNQ